MARTSVGPAGGQAAWVTPTTLPCVEQMLLRVVTRHMAMTRGCSSAARSMYFGVRQVNGHSKPRQPLEADRTRRLGPCRAKEIADAMAAMPKLIEEYKVGTLGSRPTASWHAPVHATAGLACVGGLC